MVPRLMSVVPTEITAAVAKVIAALEMENERPEICACFMDALKHRWESPLMDTFSMIINIPIIHAYQSTIFIIKMIFFCKLKNRSDILNSFNYDLKKSGYKMNGKIVKIL